MNKMKKVASEQNQSHFYDANYVLYDGACPICTAFVSHACGNDLNIVAIDARRHPTFVDPLRSHGIEINDTIVLRKDGEIYVGADAVQVLLTGGTSTNKRWAWQLLYGVATAVRRISLKFLRRSLIK